MFKFKNISTTEMKVIVEEESNLIAKASQRVEQIEVEGKNGSIYNTLGYANIERPLKLYVRDINKIDEILAWLNGGGILEYDGRISRAYFYSQIEPLRSSSIKTIDCSFIRTPFWYKKEDEYMSVDTTVINEGNVESRPIILLEKNTTDSIDLSINDVRFIYTFDEDTSVEIDCETMNAMSNGILKNRNLEIDYDFPLLNPGENSVIINSGDAVIKMKRKDCWL